MKRGLSKKGVIYHNGGTILPPATNKQYSEDVVTKGSIGSLRWNLSKQVLTTLLTMYF